MINKDGGVTKITGDAYTLVPYEILIGIGFRALSDCSAVWMLWNISSKNLDVRQKIRRYASYFQLSSRCLIFDETLCLVFDILHDNRCCLSTVSACS